MTGNTIPNEPWIDSHSVTCAICGALADERETIDLWDQENTLLEGEAHSDCWNDHDCPEDHRFAAAPNGDPDIQPSAETISVPVVCKVCGRSLRLCYDFTTIYDPEKETYLQSSTEFEKPLANLQEFVQKLVNDGEIDPEEAHYLRDDIVALRDRLRDQCKK